MDINWDEAWEYYDFYLEHKQNKSNNGFCTVINGTYYFTDGTGACDANDWNITERPNSEFK